MLAGNPSYARSRATCEPQLLDVPNRKPSDHNSLGDGSALLATLGDDLATLATLGDDLGDEEGSLRGRHHCTEVYIRVLR